MKLFVAVGLIIILALIEGFLPSAVTWSGLHVPLIVIGLSWTTLWVNPAMWPWLGLIAGATLDVTKLNPIGSLSIFYLSAMYLMYLMKPKQDHTSKTWWTQILISSVIAFTVPWYLLLANGQFGLASSEVALITLYGAGLTAIMVAIPLSIHKLRSLQS